VHSAIVDGPYPNGDRFAVRFSFDITRKATGERVKMDEVTLYTVRNGKIIREEFFYVTFPNRRWDPRDDRDTNKPHLGGVESRRGRGGPHGSL